MKRSCQVIRQAICSLMLAGALCASDQTVTLIDSGRPFGGIGTVQSLVIFDHSDSPGQNPVTVPFWIGSFPFQGTNYRFSMVGTDPALGSANTVVPVQIIPLRFELADGEVFDAAQDITPQGETALQGTLNSPLFQPMTWSTGGTNVGYTQFNDAMQRSQFWNYVSTSAPEYHVTLTPSVLPTQTLAVPANQGATFLYQGVAFTAVEYDWLQAHLAQILGRVHADPQALAIFLSHTVLIRFHGSCCVGGFHSRSQSALGQGRQAVQTYLFASYLDPGLFTDPTFGDILGLTHEISEWMNDPFAVNFIPPVSISILGTGCNPLLEVADPLDDKAYPVTLNGVEYHPQDIAFLPWFERGSPSFSVNGYYSFRNELTSLPPVCQ